MKIAIIADSHFDEGSRFDECVRIHDWIAEDAASRGCTSWLHAGDIYERKSTPKERASAADWVQRMADFVGPGVIVRGNHDAVGDLPLLGRLDTHGCGVSVVEDARVVRLGGVSVACLAWPRRGNLHSLLGAVDRDTVEAAAGDALRSVLRGLGEELAVSRPDDAKILLSHAMVRDSRTSTGQPLVGCDFELGLHDLALAKADFIALGHIHLGQDWDVGGAPAVYPGSPRRTAFGESEAKGYVVVEFDGSRLVGWERVETPATPMIHLEGDHFPDSGLELTGMEHWFRSSLSGAEVRMRYRVQCDQRDAAKAAAGECRERFLAAGATNVKIEEQLLVEQRARAPEVAAAATLAEKLERFWGSKGFEPGARRDALLGKLGELEASQHAT